MKKIAIISVLLFSGTVFISAFGLSFFISGGYAVGLDAETLGKDITFGSVGYAGYGNRYTKIGQSFRMIGEIDISMTESFSFGLAGGYLLGDPWNAAFDVLQGERMAIMATSFAPLYLTLKSHIPIGRFDFIFGAGPSACILPKSLIKDFQNIGVTEYYWEIERTYETGWGFHGLIGVEFEVTKWLSLRADVRGEQLNFKSQKDVVIAYTVDNIDMLDAALTDVHDRETIYVSDLSDYLNDPIDPNSPSQELIFNLSADSITVTVGVVVKIK